MTKVLGQQYASLAFPHDKVNTLDDIQRFTAEFLIENIDDAFYEWQHSPLLKSISFDDFKEWILPYRTVDEDFVGNKPMLRSIIYDKLFTGNAGTIYEVIENYKKYVRWQKEMNRQVISDKHIGPFDLFIPAFKMDCSNLAVYTCNYFRACGLPYTSSHHNGPIRIAGITGVHLQTLPMYSNRILLPTIICWKIGL